MSSIDSMEIVANVDELLTILIKNREQHSKIVKEAREGYIIKAKEALEKKLAELMVEGKKGKIISLSFSLAPPQDFSKTYDIAIKMLELHKAAGGGKIELSAAQVQNLVLDRWDWSDTFLYSNMHYSSTAANLAGGSENNDN